MKKVLIFGLTLLGASLMQAMDAPVPAKMKTILVYINNKTNEPLLASTIGNFPHGQTSRYYRQKNKPDSSGLLMSDTILHKAKPQTILPYKHRNLERLAVGTSTGIKSFFIYEDEENNNKIILTQSEYKNKKRTEEQILTFFFDTYKKPRLYLTFKKKGKIVAEVGETADSDSDSDSDSN